MGLDYLFNEKICKLDIESMNLHGYSFFQRLFVVMNTKKEKLLSSITLYFQVKDLDLFGIDNIWKIILCTENESVSESAVKFLIQLYDKLSITLRSKQSEIYEKLIKKIMKELYNASSLQLSAGLNQAKFRIERCLNLLQKFVEHFDSKEKKNNNSNDKSILLRK